MNNLIFTAAAICVLSVVATERVTRYDVLERNETVGDDGQVSLRQWIAWDWDHSAGVHRCQWWALDRGEWVERRRQASRLSCQGKVIESQYYRETVTHGDPELADRVAWPVASRRAPR